MLLSRQLQEDPHCAVFTALVFHYSALLCGHQENQVEWPHCICDRELIAMRLVCHRGKRVVESIVPHVFTLCPPPLGPLDTVWCLQRLMRFYVMAPDTLMYLWRPEILTAIAHCCNDSEAGRDVTRRILIRLINGVQHSVTNAAYVPCFAATTATATDGENCSVCALSQVRIAFAVINTNGFLCLEALQDSSLARSDNDAYMNNAHAAYDRFLESVESAALAFSAAVRALRLGQRAIDVLHNALRLECRRRLEPSAQHWATQILWQCDLYAYLSTHESQRTTTLYRFVWMACQQTRVDYEGARASVHAFYERYVTGQESWYSAPTNFQRMLHSLTPKLSFRLAMDTLLLERALHHLVQRYQILDTGELIPVARHLIGCFNDLRMTSATPEMITALMQFVRALQAHPEGRSVVDQLYTTPKYSGSHCNLQRLVQEHVSRDAGRIGGIPAHSLIMEPLGDSADPLELFLRQGRHDPCTVGTHLFNVENVILAMDLREFVEYLDLANALYPATEWIDRRNVMGAPCIPYQLAALLGLHYGRLVCGQAAMERRESTVRRAVRDAAPTPVDWTDCDDMAVECEPRITVCRVQSTSVMLEHPSPHLHQVMQSGVECARILTAAKVYPQEAVMPWLNDAVRGYLAAARRAMFGDEWCCSSCRREYGECAAELTRFYVAVPQHDAGYVGQLQSLEQEYGEILMYQGDNQAQWTSQ